MRRRELLRTGGLAVSTASIALPAVTVPTSSGSGIAAAFEPLDRLRIPGAKELVVDDDVAYVAATDGFATVDVSDPTAMEVLADRRELLDGRSDGPLEEIWDGKIGNDYYAVGGPANPTDRDVPHAAVVFDVSEPAAPEEVLVYETDFFNHNLDVDGDVLYLCGNDGDRNPLVCVDVETGEELGRWSVVDEDPRWLEVHHMLWMLHDVWVEDDVAYCSYWNAGTWLVDVSDPTDPTPIVGVRSLDPDEQADVSGTDERQRAQFGLPGNDHFAMPQRKAESDLFAINEEAWGEDANAAADDLGGVELWDAAAEERLARIEAPETRDATVEGVWTTAHNFDFVDDRLYTSWYRGGVRVHDVSDPTEPRELAHWRDTETTSFWTAQRGDDCVLASSWRDPSRADPEADAAVYAFPDPDDAAVDAEGSATGFGLLAGAIGIGLGAAALGRRLTLSDVRS